MANENPRDYVDGSNPYGYVHNDPVDNIDLLGLAADQCCGKTLLEKGNLVKKALNESLDDAVDESNLLINGFGLDVAGQIVGVGSAYPRPMLPVIL